MIELTYEHTDKKVLVNISLICCISQNRIEFNDHNNWITVKETYEEIKQLIKESHGR